MAQRMSAQNNEEKIVQIAVGAHPYLISIDSPNVQAWNNCVDVIYNIIAIDRDKFKGSHNNLLQLQELVAKVRYFICGGLINVVNETDINRIVNFSKRMYMEQEDRYKTFHYLDWDNLKHQLCERLLKDK